MTHVGAETCNSGSLASAWPPCVVSCARETARRPRRHWMSTRPRSVRLLPGAGGVIVNVVPPKKRPPPRLKRRKPVSPPVRTTRQAVRVRSKNWMRIRIHWAASARLGTEARTPTWPGAVAGSQTLIVAQGERRNCASARAGPRTPARRTPVSASARTRRVAVTTSPYRAGRRGEVGRIRARGVRMTGAGEAPDPPNDLSVAAPVEGHEPTQHERRLPRAGRHERERPPRLADARVAVAEVQEAGVGGAPDAGPRAVRAAELHLDAHEELVATLAGSGYRAADPDPVRVADRVADVDRRPRLGVARGARAVARRRGGARRGHGRHEGHARDRRERGDAGPKGHCLSNTATGARGSVPNGRSRRGRGVSRRPCRRPTGSRPGCPS